VKVRALAAATCLIVLGGGYAGSQVPTASNGPYRISVDVSLVVLHATVSSRKGGFVSSLREQDFQIYEDGVPQRIHLLRHEDIPVTVGLVVDHSGSMAQKMPDVIAAARIFVQSSNPEDEMFVVNFNENVTLGLPDAIPFTDCSAELERAIGSALATGQTALHDAIARALERLEAGTRDKKVVIVISDGDDTASTRSRAQALKMAEQSSAIIYTVGLFDHNDPDVNPGVLKRLARATGGESFFPEQLSEVVAICERIASDIRNQYTIGYVSTNTKQDGEYRAIRVLARAKGHRRLVVRTRAGYIAGGEPRPGRDDGAR
jgi:Ca-activated chloride channel family protein